MQRALNWYPRINTRIIVPFLLITLVVAGMGVFIVTRLVSGSITERLNNQLANSAVAASNAVIEVEQARLATLRTLVFTQGVAPAMQAGDTAALENLLIAPIANSEADDILLINAAGQVISHYERNPATLDYRLRSDAIDVTQAAGLQRVLRGETDTVGDKFIDIIALDQEQGFFVTAPVRDAADQLVGVVSVGTRFRALARNMTEQALSAVTLYDGLGHVLTTTTLEGNAVDLALSPADVTSLITQTSTFSPVLERNFGGMTYQVLYAPLQIRSETVGLMAVALPSAFVVDQISTSRDSIALLFALLLLAVVIIGLLISRSIVRPVLNLVSTTRAIRDGDLSRRVGRYAPDEIGELSVSFDHMTDQLVERNQQVNLLYHEQLAETARRDAILGSISDAVMVFDLDGNAIHVNDAARDLSREVRHSRSEYIRFRNLVRSPEDLMQPQFAEFANRFFSALATPVRTPANEMLGYAVVLRDITDVIESERLKDQLILQLSHELRTPMGSIKGYVELAKMFQASKPQQTSDYLDKAISQINNYADMVNRVVYVSEILTNQFDVEMERVDLVALVDEVSEQHQSTAADAGVSLEVDLPAQPVDVEADPRRIAQAFEQVLRNATSYTLAGGQVRVSVGYDEDLAYIVVSDTGVGITAEEQEKVFERMVRGSSADAGPTDSRGLGVGLYVARHIMTVHHGQIYLRSAIGSGTSVHMILPVRQPIPDIPTMALE